MSSKPSANGSNGRGADGRFLPGHPGGPGNPFAQKVAKLRAALLDSVTPADVQAIIRSMIAQAVAGDTAAAKLVPDRLFGRPAQTIEIDPPLAVTSHGQTARDAAAELEKNPAFIEFARARACANVKRNGEMNDDSND